MPIRTSLLKRLILATIISGWAGAAQALELMMFTQPGCVYCKRWERDVEPIYQRSAEGQRARLVKQDIHADRTALKLKEPVIYTPTFVLIEDNAEIGRMTGYINDDMFWGLLGKMLASVPVISKTLPEPARNKP